MSPRASLLEYALVFAFATVAVSLLTLKDEMDLLLRLDVVGYAKLHGFRLDRVKVDTLDGWQLEVHRIRNMDIFDGNMSAPVLLSHGFGYSSVDFMTNTRNGSLSFILADRGFDVWAVNYRGNKFSNRVLKKGNWSSPRSQNYYRTTWQYMAEHDVPAVLDKIDEVTKQEKVYMIGHCIGATLLFAFLSNERFIKYHERVLYFVALAPVIRFGEDTPEAMRDVLETASYWPRLVSKRTFKTIFGQRILRFDVLGDMALKKACLIVTEICDMLDEILETKGNKTTSSSPHIDWIRDPLHNILYPAGATVMNLYQFSRQYGKAHWEKMDYDELPGSKITNMEEYGQARPPRYEFSKIKVEFIIYFTKKEKYFGILTAMKLVREMGLGPKYNRGYRIIKSPTLGHHDLVWGFDTRCYVYDDMIRYIERLEGMRGAARLEYLAKSQKYEQRLLNRPKCPVYAMDDPDMSIIRVPK